MMGLEKTSIDFIRETYNEYFEKGMALPLRLAEVRIPWRFLIL